MIKSLQSNKYQYSFSPATVASPLSERFGAARFDDLLEQQRADLFLKKNSLSLSSTVFAVAFVFKNLRIMMIRERSGLYSTLG